VLYDVRQMDGEARKGNENETPRNRNPGLSGDPRVYHDAYHHLGWQVMLAFWFYVGAALALIISAI